MASDLLQKVFGLEHPNLSRLLLLKLLLKLLKLLKTVVFRAPNPNEAQLRYVKFRFSILAARKQSLCQHQETHFSLFLHELFLVVSAVV